MTKKVSLPIKIALCIMAILIIIPTTVGAVTITNWVKATVGKDIQIVWDGKYYTPTEDNGTPVYPLVYNGRTYLPIRFVTEKAGLDVQWDSPSKTIFITSSGDFIDNNDDTSNTSDKEVPGKTNIHAMTYFSGSDPWVDVWNNVKSDFMQNNPEVNIVDDSVPAANDQFSVKVNTSFAAGNEPDVCLGFTGYDAKPMVDSGKLLSWESEIAKDTAWSSKFSKGALESVKYSDGKQYALPYIGYCEGMYYNEALFKKYNVKVPTNYSELLNAVEVFKAKNIVPITVSFVEEPHYLIETFILSLGGPKGHDTLFDPSWAPALNYIKELYQKGAFPKDALTIKSSAATQLFLDEKAAMFISGSWSAGGFKDYKGNFDISDTAKIMPLPLLPNGKANPTDIIAGFGSGWYVSKDKNTQKQGIPVSFVKYITTPEVSAEFISIGGLPAIKGNYNGTLSQNSLYNLVANANSVSVPIDSYMKPESFKIIWKGLTPLVTGKKTAEQLLSEAKALNY